MRETWLRTQLSKSKILATDPIALWKIDGETKETVTDFLFLVSKIIAYDDCRQENTLAPWKESYKKPRHTETFKSRDTTLPTKANIVKDMVFLVIMYGCECWTIKKANC